MDQEEPLTHFMLKEIYEQPKAVFETARGSDLHGIGAELLESVRGRATEFERINRILIAASGTSRHAGMAGKFMIESLAHVPVEVDYSSELQYSSTVMGPDTLIIVITQSGETADTLGALRLAKKVGSLILAISNVADSSIMREADAGIHTKAGPELAVPSTKAFTAQLTALFVFALWMAELRKTITSTEVQRHLAELALMPEKLSSVLSLDPSCQELAKKYFWCGDFLFAGRGIHYPIAMDGALKFKEVAYLHAEGYPLGEMRHGPIATIDESITVFVIATCDRSDPESVLRYEKTITNIKELKTRSGKVIALANQADREVEKLVDDVLYLRSAPELLLPLLEIVPLQLFAYHFALLHGRDVDRPRNLTKAILTD